MPKERFTITAVDNSLDAVIRNTIDNKTKPPGSLGQLEAVAAQVARIQHSLSPQLSRLNHCVFAADHGVCAEGVSPYPSDVTRQMVMNFMAGGAAINVFCRQQDVRLTVVDAGLNGDTLPTHPNLIDARLGNGSANFMRHPAMTRTQYQQAVNKAAEIVEIQLAEGADILSFGEMGIGSTTSGAALMAACLKLDPNDCVGAGTGADQALIEHKATVVRQALALHQAGLTSGRAIMQHLGGFELAMMAGAMAATAELGKPFIVDGFLATAALMTVWYDHPDVLDYALFSHASGEQGHQRMLDALGATPLLQLDLRLGEGTGAVLAWPLIRAAVAMLNDMASFDSAGVDTAGDD
ncbi:nicotinate-nucleotide--dimethylbenzimidazole phosphoribosyltransferase [Saccharospirillum impatiens]|uniref:nicotinate-nucleotide--dimethylbenzimidazole phosphoribosyltransferase n=1 Tax=Saccharospirillum impatiens TaxID=169438 RepID=UPI000404ABB8|nr:nicotinate-nucleotide--dimethylbenzimidazole phosphoribosyltransferase [Saccharospirillum impatiens]